VDPPVVTFPVFDDPRGRLVPVEFDGLPFTPERVFVVVAPEEGATRGDHGVPCRELLVLVTGTARVVLTTRRGDDPPEVAEHHLGRPGEACLIEPGADVVYHLTPGATVVVLADQAYVG
jgi:hypothetical protein